MLSRFCFFVLLWVPLLGFARGERVDRERWDNQPTGRWVAELVPGVDPQRMADKLGLRFQYFIAEPAWGLVVFEPVGPMRHGALPPGIDETYQLPDGLVWLEFESWLVRERRSLPTDEPHFPRQWHLLNEGQRGGLQGADANVVPVWNQGITGQGVVIAVVDSGFDVMHPELLPNFRDDLSLNVFANSLSVPSSPERQNTDGEEHGTPVAAISVGALNGRDGIGAAFNAQWAGRRFLTGASTTDAQEAAALTWRSPQIHVSNNSWGPRNSVASMRSTTQTAVQNAVRDGRDGRGTIFVFAGGNGRREHQNSNFNGYTNSIHTIAVAAMGQGGVYADYSEPGANILIAAPSRGGGAGILTADVRGLQGYSTRDYVENFGGTSAAAPIVSGVIALMLEARPELGWRDVQHILARTAVRTDYEHPGWQINGAGHPFSHDYGFGRIDALGAVELARVWPLVGTAQSWNSGWQVINSALPINVPVRRSLSIAQNLRAEHVLVRVDAGYNNWADLEINLISPSGTVSRLAVPHANSNAGSIGSWTFMTLANWDESSQGQWQLEVINRGGRGTGNLSGWQLSILGTEPLPRQGLIDQAPATQVLQWHGAALEIDPLAQLINPGQRPLRVISAHRPALGELIPLDNGRFQYRMRADARGRDTFGFTIVDDQGVSIRRYFQVVNPLPAANFIAFPTRTGQSLLINPLVNDFDPLRSPLELVSFSQTLRGTVTREGDLLRYTPRAGFSGWDRFAYTIRSQEGFEDTGFVRIDVLSEPDFLIRFDGVNDHVEFPASSGFNLTAPLRVETSFFATGYGEFDTGFGRIFDKDKVLLFLVGYEHAFYNDESLILFLRFTNGEQVAANTPRGSIQLNRWHHVIAEYVPERSWDPIRIWIDGVSVLPLAFPAQVGPLPRNREAIATNSNDPLFIGESALLDRAFMGDISYVRISTGNNTSNPIFAPWLHVNFEEGQSTAIHATGSAGRTGVLRGGRWNSRLSPEDAAASQMPDTVIFDDGWWHDNSFGYLYADAWPWLFWPGRGWQFTVPEDSGFWLFNPVLAPNWRFTHPAIWPIHWGEGQWFID